VGRPIDDKRMDGTSLKKAKMALPTLVFVLLFMIVRPLVMGMPGTTVFVDPKESNVKVGQTFAVNITIMEVTGLLGFDFLLSYNTAVLELTSIQEGPFLKSVDPTFMINLTTPGLIWLAVVLYDTQGRIISANGTGVLATATFKAIGEGESSLDLFSKDPYLPNEVKLATDPPPDDVVHIPNVAVDGHVVVSSDPDPPASDPPPTLSDPPPTPIVGDINSDGKVDMKDVGYASARFGTYPTGLLWDAKADVNGDGKINMKDVGIVAKNFGKTST
jgi:hypothetical protein